MKSRKSLQVALGVLLCVPALLYAQQPEAPKTLPATLRWTAQTSGVLARLSAVFFADREHGWIVGSNSTVLSTEDGGNTWKKTQLINHELLRDVFFLDTQRGFLLGEYSLFNRTDNRSLTERSFLMSTSDAGSYWRMASLARPVSSKSDTLTRYGGEVLVRMHFASDRTGWICGETGTILATTDGGRNWKLQRAAQVRRILFGLTAIDELQAWIVGAGGVALRTIDGGENWNEQPTGTTKTLFDVHFTDARRGWAVGSGGTILATVNGGNRWRAQDSGTSEDLNDVCFVSAQEGWAAGNRGTLLHTRDGGSTWEDVSLKTRANLTRLFFIAPDCGWVVGDNGKIFKYHLSDAAPRPAINGSEQAQQN
ncbi:MAG TPA: YCF48-related protein [Blastocatellia bacterium]|nr:YCF48-related protein [Blastocatellia bacterium]